MFQKLKHQHHIIYAILIGALGVAMFSAKAVMVKLAYQYSVDALSILTLRMLFAFPFYVFFALNIKKGEEYTSLKRKELLSIIFLGVIGYYLASYFDFLGLQYISAGQERIILFAYPTIVLVLSRIFLKKTIKGYQVIAILITYLGIVITLYPQLVNVTFSKSYFLGAGLVFLSALTYATYLVGSNWLIPKLGVIRFTSYAMIIACISVFIHYLVHADYQLFTFNRNVYLIGFLIATISTVAPSYLVSYAIKLLGAPNFSIIGSLGPIFTILLAYIVLGEKTTSLQIIGALVVISGILILSKQKPKTP